MNAPTRAPHRARALALAGVVAGIVIVLPLLGAITAGREIARFVQFPPPLEIPTGYLRFSWWAVGAVVSGLALVTWSWWSRLRHRASPPRTLSPGPARRTAFPTWGAIAIVWILAWWLLAWTRFTWFEPLQRYTFFPLWIGFIVGVNALTTWRTQSCLMLRAPAQWLRLFPASAVCWWVFEWLNRFVQNWHYLGVPDFGATGYALHATLCFSTVLPAVAAVAELIDTYPRWTAITRDGPPWPWLTRRPVGTILLVTGAIALLGAGRFPTLFYPALWVAPLAVAWGVSVWAGTPGLPQEIAVGDWRRAATWMFASLICGFFWELWNWHSAAKWIYTVPGVDRWHVFEMPALGYLGYLPFGVECLLATHFVVGNAWSVRRHDRDTP